LTETELRKNASDYRSRALNVREQALCTTSLVARNSLFMAATTWDRLAQAREADADMLKSDGADTRLWR